MQRHKGWQWHGISFNSIQFNACSAHFPCSKVFSRGRGDCKRRGSRKGASESVYWEPEGRVPNRARCASSFCVPGASPAMTMGSKGESFDLGRMSFTRSVITSCQTFDPYAWYM